MADHNAVANKWFAAAALFATALLLAADGPDLLAKTVRFQLQSPGGPPQDDPEDLFSWSASSAAAEQPGDPDLFAWPAAMSEKSAPAPQLLPPAPTAEGLFPALQPQSHELAKTGKLAVRAPHATDVPAAVELSPSHKYSAVNPLRVLIVGCAAAPRLGASAAHPPTCARTPSAAIRLNAGPPAAEIPSPPASAAIGKRASTSATRTHNGKGLCSSCTACCSRSATAAICCSP